ncbi:MAG: GDP-mannose 4,6-dehydratase [Microthrixaceae bacterium]
MRALVTGSGGFVGPHLTAHLRDEGDEVLTPTHAGCDVDIRDLDALVAAFDRAEAEVVYHLAGASDVGGSWKDPSTTFRVNAEGTLNVLTAARRTGVRRVLTVGSADVYGKVGLDELPITEASELRPTSPYAASKVAADYVAVQAGLGYDQDVIRVRAFNHLGPGQRPSFVAPAIATRIAANERDGSDVVPIGNLSSRRDFTDVRDVVAAYRLLMLRGEAGAVYNVCSGVDVSVQELADRLISMATRPMRLEVDPSLFRPVDIPVLRGDRTKVSSATGWAPTVPLDRTLSDLLAACRNQVADGA